ncbi:MAG: hypothetical protein AAFW60_08345 [Pseudomonadota bacterium]
MMRLDRTTVQTADRKALVGLLNDHGVQDEELIGLSTPELRVLTERVIFVEL